ncbi:class 1 fructose-bisphosphatase [Terriglobus aquaticus]|uniref:Fructose-1,6-bisphosphatase class 1 n=1 Tax=Terriglobus aquaticus TaxID=940139 RepID=A0ABW9KID7_9BACT|nr:class 1 fructose-bisphosphatase [Terriglobus aquaticus]
MAKTLVEHVRAGLDAERGAALAELFAALADAAKQIEARIRTAPLSDALGAFGHTNVQGEQQQKLDVFANDAVIGAMRALPSVGAVVSEEDDEPVVFEGKPDARFVVITDPLDGSSNLDVDVNVGTIVSVQAIVAGEDARAAALKPGTQQVAALYVNYGPATMLVYTVGKGTHAFTLRDGEFLLSGEHLAMPEQGPYYSVNEANAADFPQAVRSYLTKLRDGSMGAKYGSRYVGSFIADFHRTLLKGGVFLYPGTAKAPGGKLRLLYEANPLAMLAEQAGGKATTAGDANGGEVRRILEVVPTAPHVRTTLVIGSTAEVSAFGDVAAAAASQA